MSEGIYPHWENRGPIPPFREFCDEEGIKLAAHTLSWIVPGRHMEVKGSALAQLLRSHSGYRQMVSGTVQGVDRVGMFALRAPCAHATTEGANFGL